MLVTVPLAVTILSSVAWSVALLAGKSRSRRRLSAEFWWAWLAIVPAGFVALFSIGVLTGDANVASFIRMIPLIVAGIVLVLQSLAAHTLSINWAGGLIAAYFVLILSYSLGGEPVSLALLSLGLFLPVVFSRRTGYDFEQLSRGLRVGGLTAVSAIAVIAMATSASFFGPCRTDKCSIWGLSIGTAGDGNALGIFYAVAASLTLLVVGGAWRFVLVSVSSLALVDLTSSRTALYSWVFGVIIVGVHRLCQKAGSNIPQALTAVLLGATCIILPLLPYRGDEFTYRATLWLSARNLAADSPFLGYGSGFWVRLGGESGISANYSTHNLTMEVLVAGGIIGCLLVGGALISAVFTSPPGAPRLWTLSLVCVLLSASLTEVTSAPGRPYLFPGLAVLVLLAVSSQSFGPWSTTRSGKLMRRDQVQGVVTH